MRVLIVEDEWMVAKLIESTLADAGMEVIGKPGSVAKALQAIAASSPDIVVLDANLAGTSAEPVARELEARGIPFLVVSGYAKEQKSGLLAQAPFITKPFELDALVAAVQQLAIR
jgi:DNA-binding response OmpR family regulator